MRATKQSNKNNGNLQHFLMLQRSVSLRYDFYKGIRKMKLLDSNEIQQLQDACVFEINGMEVFM